MSAEPRSATPADPVTPPPAGLLNVLLAVAVVALMAALVGFVGWWRSSHRQVELVDLDRDDRQRLVEEILTLTGRGQTPTWYEPGVAYTLKPRSSLDIWGAKFVSNSVGYRTGPLEKPPDTFRVVFVGDSWTYGMGVTLEESFPKQFERLVRDQLTPEQLAGRQIEAWTLALPGYNSVNYLTALEIHFDALAPDAVVICPTRNDNDSNYFILPNGSNRRATGHFVDRFGDDQALSYRHRYLDSYRYLERWKKVFGSFADTASWLEARHVPLVFFFIAHWEPEFVHYQMRQADVAAPYAIGPQEVMGARWAGPPPYEHGNPAAYGQYARMAYRLLAPRVGWPALPEDPEIDQLHALQVDEPPVVSWPKVHQAIERWYEDLPTRFERGGEDDRHCPSDLNCRSGHLGRSGTVLLMREPGAQRLRLTVERLAALPSLYPLELEVRIPRPDGGPSVTTVVPADGPPLHTFEMPLPADVPAGSVMEIELRPQHVRLAAKVRSLRSISLASAVQVE